MLHDDGTGGRPAAFDDRARLDDASARAGEQDPAHERAGAGPRARSRRRARRLQAGQRFHHARRGREHRRLRHVRRAPDRSSRIPAGHADLREPGGSQRRNSGPTRRRVQLRVRRVRAAHRPASVPALPRRSKLAMRASTPARAWESLRAAMARSPRRACPGIASSVRRKSSPCWTRCSPSQNRLPWRRRSVRRTTSFRPNCRGSSCPRSAAGASSCSSPARSS